MIKNYFKIAFRGFWKHKLFTLINIIGLSIGISAALVIYLIVNFDFSFDKFQPDNNKIYRIVSDFKFSGEVFHSGGVTGPLAEAVKNEVTGLKASAPFYDNYQFTAVIPNGSSKAAKFKNQKNVIFADGRYFAIFPYRWISGSPASALNNPSQVVLTAKQAKLYFPSLGYDKMIGRTIIYDDSIKTTVTGIIQDIKENTDLNFHDFISFSTINLYANKKSDLTGWGNETDASQLFIKLNENTNADHIEKQLNSLLKKYNPPKPEDKGNSSTLRLQPLSDVHFNADYSSYSEPVANKTTLYGLMIIAAFILLLGCINFINLTTAQASHRAKEIGIRKTMGSSRSQLIVQFLGETYLITILAIIISVVLTPYLLKVFADFIPVGVKLDFIHQWNILIFLFLLSLVISFLSGFYPALILSGYKPALVLKNQSISSAGKTRNAWLRKSLTVTQFVIAQFFIMATIMVSKQVYYALHKDLGFKKDAIIYVPTSWKGDQNRRWVFMNKLHAIPQIENMSMGGEPPSSYDNSSSSSTYKDGKKEIKTEVLRKRGDTNYIDIYKIKLLAGHNFRSGDTLKSLLINNTYARILGFRDPHDVVGKTLKFNGTVRVIIGVVADFYQSSLHNAFKPIAILFDPKNSLTLHIALKPQSGYGNDWKTAIAGIQQAWKEVYPDDDFEYHFFDESIAEFYESEQHTSKLLTWATGISIFISCLGLLGLAIYTTNQRTKEIGVRKVLGASVAQIFTLLSTELIWLILLAFVIVTPVAWYAMNKWMQGFADRTTISWWIFAASGVGMLLAAIFTSSFQTVKAAIANPVKSLRSE
jgi:ABC-type antimicrobial peptide transport system permease subunit